MRKNTELVGVVNVNADSFHAPSRFMEDEAVTRVTELFNQGASFVDIGAESTRPGAEPITPDEEWRRLEPVLQQVIGIYPESISVDTRHHETLERTLEIGRFVANAVTMLNDPRSEELVTGENLGLILCHFPFSSGADFTAAHKLKQSEPVKIADELIRKIERMHDNGYEGNYWLDPWIGLGKDAKTNHELLKFPLLVPEHQTMLGWSNKRTIMINEWTGEKIALPNDFTEEELQEFKEERNRLCAQTAINAGASLLRVHDPLLYADLVR